MILFHPDHLEIIDLLIVDWESLREETMILKEQISTCEEKVDKYSKLVTSYKGRSDTLNMVVTNYQNIDTLQNQKIDDLNKKISNQRWISGGAIAILLLIIIL